MSPLDLGNPWRPLATCLKIIENWGKVPIFRCPKMGLRVPNPKSETTFSRQHPPKMVEKVFVLLIYHFWTRNKWIQCREIAPLKFPLKTTQSVKNYKHFKNDTNHENPGVFSNSWPKGTQNNWYKFGGSTSRFQYLPNHHHQDCIVSFPWNFWFCSWFMLLCRELKCEVLTCVFCTNLHQIAAFHPQ